MTDYRIWGKVEQVCPGEFLALVSAVPVGLRLPGVMVMHSTEPTRELALTFIEKAAVEMGAAVREGDGRVVDIELE